MDADNIHKNPACQKVLHVVYIGLRDCNLNANRIYFWVGCVSSIKTVKDSNPCNIINFPKTKKELTLKILIHTRKTSPNISIWHYVDVFVLTKRHCTMQCLNHLCMYCLPIRTNKMARLRRCKDLVHMISTLKMRHNPIVV